MRNAIEYDEWVFMQYYKEDHVTSYIPLKSVRTKKEMLVFRQKMPPITYHAKNAIASDDAMKNFTRIQLTTAVARANC